MLFQNVIQSHSIVVESKIVEKLVEQIVVNQGFLYLIKNLKYVVKESKIVHISSASTLPVSPRVANSAEAISLSTQLAS